MKSSRVIQLTSRTVVILIAASHFLLFSASSAQGRTSGNSEVLSDPSAGASPVFEVATVKVNRDGTNMGMQYTPEGFTALNTTLAQLIQEAYGMYEKGQIVGSPAWTNLTSFDIVAKVDSANTTVLRTLDLNQRRQMLQVLLADRFGLVTHFENRDFPVYELIVAKGGSRLRETKPPNTINLGIKGMHGLILHSAPGVLTVQDFSMEALARQLSTPSGRMVIDKTGLAGSYDFTLHWQADLNQPDQQSEPSLFTALQEQLGIGLKPAKSSIQVLVVDHIVMPSPN